MLISPPLGRAQLHAIESTAARDSKGRSHRAGKNWRHSRQISAALLLFYRTLAHFAATLARISLDAKCGLCYYPRPLLAMGFGPFFGSWAQLLPPTHRPKKWT